MGNGRYRTTIRGHNNFVARSATRLGGYERTQSPVGPAEAHSCNFRDIIDFLTMHPGCSVVRSCVCSRR
jgi:hypothetical protein